MVEFYDFSVVDRCFLFLEYFTVSESSRIAYCLQCLSSTSIVFYCIFLPVDIGESFLWHLIRSESRCFWYMQPVKIKIKTS
jgi:hypothetical protein